MIRRWGILTTAGCTLALLGGCVIGRVYRDRPLDEGAILGIQRGVTTKSEILATFGPPQEIEARELVAIGTLFEPFVSRRGNAPPEEKILGARYFRYTYSRANASGMILLLFNYGEFDQKNDTLVIFFNDNDVVEDYAFAKDTERLPRFGPWSR
jgi:hypothetical protein